MAAAAAIKVRVNKRVAQALQQPVDDMNIKSPFQKLLFGVVAKFSLSSAFL
ncbi:MAG TPA: hypothetical protein VL727_16990 [Puia sp.]|jgi:hypothetical protein|nr:hypothetical protein [Puia sp.]